MRCFTCNTYIDSCMEKNAVYVLIVFCFISELLIISNNKLWKDYLMLFENPKTRIWYFFQILFSVLICLWFLSGSFRFAESTNGPTVPNKVNEDDYEIYDDVLDFEKTPANENIQQNVAKELDIDKPSCSSVEISKQSSHQSNQIERVHCFNLFKLETVISACNQLCPFRSNRK